MELCWNIHKFWKRNGKSHSLGAYYMSGHCLRCSHTYVCFSNPHSQPVPLVIWFLLCRCRSSPGSEMLSDLANVIILSASGRIGNWAWAFWFYAVPAILVILTFTTELVLFYSTIKTMKWHRKIKTWLENKKWMQSWAKTPKEILGRWTSPVLSQHF